MKIEAMLLKTFIFFILMGASFEQQGQNELKSSDHNLLSKSILFLSNDIASGAIFQQYERLDNENNDLAISEAIKPKNAHKNRYIDVSPYDQTRVILHGNDDEDYINANYINMETSNGKINHYIATQGPLATTVKDFWRMVHQENSHLIVMLTTLIEHGYAKCLQYWPSLNEILDMGDGFTVRGLNETLDSAGSFVERKFFLNDNKTGESRTIQHIQYLAWPDHGVPSDSKQFLDFTEKVRLTRNKIEEELNQDTNKLNNESKNSNPPIIIHCSAGVGRTGVLILMDTALTIMDAEKPIYPLDILQVMRNQRASMVQNVGQYKFVCECIIAAYDEMMKQEDKTITRLRQ